VSFNRRDFLKLTAASSAVVAVPARGRAGEAAVPDQGYGILVDTVACVGCRKCEWACNDVSGFPKKDLKDYDDLSVLEKPRRPTATANTVVNRFVDPANPGAGATWSAKVQCMHCLRPACVSACIVGALKREPSGAVVYDAGKCMGCRYCMVACPFQVPTYEYDNAFTPKVQKCSLCHERMAQGGQAPACVSICPREALTYGPRAELVDLAWARIHQTPGRYVEHVYGEHEVGGTAYLYLTPVPAQHAGLPVLGTRPLPEHTEPLQHAIFAGFLPPLALFGVLSMAMRSFKADDDDDREADS
jgi:Fe-S-cluster-containing dehydrogenase component